MAGHFIYAKNTARWMERRCTQGSDVHSQRPERYPHNHEGTHTCVPANLPGVYTQGPLCVPLSAAPARSLITLLDAQTTKCGLLMLLHAGNYGMVSLKGSRGECWCKRAVVLPWHASEDTGLNNCYAESSLDGRSRMPTQIHEAVPADSSICHPHEVNRTFVSI